MKLFAIILCELIVIRNFIRFFSNYCPEGIGKGKDAIINFIVDFFELMAVIVAPILLMTYC